MADETKKLDDGGPAHPQHPDVPMFNPNGELTGWASEYMGKTDPGMSLRDYFAAQALPAVIEIAFADPADAFASREQAAKRGKTPFAAAADMAYEFANAMVARKQQP
jgi:hypothetical protein